MSIQWQGMFFAGDFAMGCDPDFDDVFRGKPVAARRGRFWRRVGLFAVAVVSFLAFVQMRETGSPIPFCFIEFLDHPVAVAEVGEDALRLEDGREIRLPFMKRLPQGDPAFAKALERGVEINPSGEAFGLINPPRMCGNDLTFYDRRRINLSDLAGLLDPGGIDDSIVNPDLIEEIVLLKGDESPASYRRGMPRFVTGRAARVRQIYEFAKDRAKGGEATIVRPRGFD